MRVMGLQKNRVLFLGLAVALTLVAMVVFAAPVSAAGKTKQKQAVKQKTFATPEIAVNTFVEALKKGNKKDLLAIFGSGSEWLISSGDKVRDKATREDFLKKYEEKNSLDQKGEGKVVLSVGKDDFPFAIPIVKKGAKWYFDTKAGKEESLNRRIGKNELNVIEVLYAYGDAQREFASKDRDGDGIIEFAQRVWSSEGKHDGLYWEAKEGEEESPFGPSAAKASAGGYVTGGKGGPSPYYGYYFKILKAQGENATGGAFDYVVNGKMILGFALVAYPAQYGSSGIMTFIVNQQGVIYQKDLGRNTGKVAKAMTAYDPDTTWKKVEETQK